MALSYIGTLPERMTVADVVTYNVIADSLPATIIARRATLDELVYDADRGFTDAWKPFSSLTETVDGFQLVLGRRAFSAAGSQVFWTDGVSGGDVGTLAGDVTGASDANTVTSLQGTALDLTGAVNGDVVKRVAGVWTAEPDASGSFTGDTDDIPNASSAAGTSLTDALDGIEARLDAVEATDYYSGYATSAVTDSGTSWVALSTMLTFIDQVSSNISRSGATFTFTRAGTYRVSVQLNYTVSAPTDCGLRLRAGSTTLVMRSHYNNDNQLLMDGVFVATAGMSATLQAVRTGASGATYGAATLDGEPQRNLNLVFVRIGD